MNRIVKNLFIGSGFYRPLILLCVFFITACSGGALVFDGGNEVHIEINENTAGSVWTSKAQVVGQSEIKPIVYELAGADAALFSINSATGALSFKIPADFEQPLDADKNNEYKITVEAKINGKSSGQQVYLQIKNITQPVVELIKPKPNENVGTGETIEVETLVRFYDAESNTPVPEGRITLNSIPMEPSSEDAQIWKSKTSVPEEGVNLSISAFTSLAASVDIEEKLLNKRNSANVNYVWAVQGDWMLVAGGELDILTSFNFATKEMIEAGTGLYYPQELPDVPMIKCHPSLFVCYGLTLSATPVSFSFGSEAIEAAARVVIYGISQTSLPANTIDFAIDDEHRRAVYVSKTSSQLSLSTTALGAFGNVVDEKVSLLFNLPSDVFKEGYKQFEVHGRTNTYIFTEQRMINGISQAFVRGFNENAVQRFESQLGPDISNLVVHESAGLIYVAENFKTSRAKLKTIDIASGVVKDLIDEKNTVSHGAYSGLTLDQVNDRLYVADSISDSIYMVDLKTKSMRELPYRFIPYANPPLIEN